MPVLSVTHNGITKSIAASGSESVLSELAKAGFCWVSALCGGTGRCGRCAVKASGTFRSVDFDKTLTASDETIFSCRWIPVGNCSVVLPDTAKAQITTGGMVDITPDINSSGLGVAIDIGTTTAAAFLFDLQSGKLLTFCGDLNAQGPFGADVISRIRFASDKNGLETLSDLIKVQLSRFMDTLCASALRKREEISRISIAGNTVMEHIFASLSPESIGVSPFTPLSFFGDSIPASEYFSGLRGDAELYLCPAVSGYVGGDITAGLLSSGAASSDELCLFLDLGTNGEMALGNKNGFLCCAVAAGPAFEGVGLKCGLASEGAINRIDYVNQTLAIDTIGGGKARGICGSGLIDALAVMLRCGAMDSSGRLRDADEVPPQIRGRLRTQDGEKLFCITGDICISASDIRALQLAKAAVRGGIETLLELSGKTYRDVGNVLIAGGFGAWVNIGSAREIGLLPPELCTKARHIGVAAAAGAAITLTDEGRSALAALAAGCRYCELSGSPVFYEKYLDHMVFGEADI